MLPDKTPPMAKVLQALNKPMLKSKKFVGFQIIEWSWKILLAYGIYSGMDSAVLLAMVTAAGTAETAFLGSLAWHDKNIKSASIRAAGAAPAAQPEEPSHE